MSKHSSDACVLEGPIALDLNDDYVMCLLGNILDDDDGDNVDNYYLWEGEGLCWDHLCIVSVLLPGLFILP